MVAPRPIEETSRSGLPQAQQYEMLRAVLDWIHDLMAEKPEADDSIDWEDGEEHDKMLAPPAP
jgi:hypothetical protein